MTLKWNSWNYIGSADLSRFALPGFKTKAYLRSYAIAFAPDIGVRKYSDTRRIMLVAIVHSNANKVKYELGMFKTSVERINGNFSGSDMNIDLIPASAYKVLYGDDLSTLLNCMPHWSKPWSSSTDGKPKMEIEVQNDRVFFVCDKRKAMLHIGGIGASHMHMSPVQDIFDSGISIGEMGVVMCHPDKVHSLSDASDIYTAICSLRTTSLDVDSKWYDNEIQSEIQELNKNRVKLSEVESDIQKVCEDAADSLNTLSEKYGIELAL